MASLKATVRESDEQMAAVQQRLLELRHSREHELGYKRRTEIVIGAVEPLEREGHFPQAQYAFDTGVLTLNRTTGHSYTQAAICEMSPCAVPAAIRACTAAGTSGVS